jgi:hypothetical protein
VRLFLELRGSGGSGRVLGTAFARKPHLPPRVVVARAHGVEQRRRLTRLAWDSAKGILVLPDGAVVHRRLHRQGFVRLGLQGNG